MIHLYRPPARQDLFAVRGYYCPLGVSYVKFRLVFENQLPVCGNGSITEIRAYFQGGPFSTTENKSFSFSLLKSQFLFNFNFFLLNTELIRSQPDINLLHIGGSYHKKIKILTFRIFVCIFWEFLCIIRHGETGVFPSTQRAEILYGISCYQV